VTPPPTAAAALMVPTMEETKVRLVLLVPELIGDEKDDGDHA